MQPALPLARSRQLGEREVRRQRARDGRSRLPKFPNETRMNQPTDAPQEAASVAPASGRYGAQARRGGQAALRAFYRDSLRARLHPESSGDLGLARWPGACDTSLVGFCFSAGLFQRHAPAWNCFSFRATATSIRFSALRFGSLRSWHSSASGLPAKRQLFWSQKDPQRVVIDEVSGQHLTLLLGCGMPIWWRLSRPGLIRSWDTSRSIPPSTGNICCWVLYFFECLTSGSLFQRGKRSRCRAAGASWRTIGSPGFTRGSDCGSRARRACNAARDT